MENFVHLFQGFGTALSLANILAAIVGALLGLVIGAMPGIGSLAGCALLLPLTFRLDPTTAIIMLAAIYYANMYGGAFSSILLNIPGDSAAILTALDGFPMTQNGKAGKALFAANISSFVGGTIGIIMLTVLAPALAVLGLKFGPAEMVALLVFALTSIGSMLDQDSKCGLVATGFGILLAMVGMDPTSGTVRYTFGNINLLSGLDFVPLVIGMFGFSQVIEMLLEDQDMVYKGKDKLTIRGSFLNKQELKAIMPISAQGGVMGTLMGLIPGSGATIASFVCYMIAKKTSKRGKEFGTGIVEGVAAAEAANNSASVGAFAPLLSLGIPGSGTTAVLLGGLMMWGLQPGPQLFAKEPEFVWGLIASMYIGNLICFIIAIAVIPFLVSILKVPSSIMIPIIMVLCVVGAYSANNNMFDVYVMLVSGALSYILSVNNIPIAPLLLSFVLTPRLESSFTQALQISHGSFAIFVQKPISLTLLIGMLIFIIAPTIVRTVRKRNAAKQGAADA